MSRVAILKKNEPKAGSVDVMKYDISRETTPVGMAVLFMGALGISISPIDSPSARELPDV